MIGLRRSRQDTYSDYSPAFPPTILAVSPGLPCSPNVVLPSLPAPWSLQPCFPPAPWHTPAQCNGLRFSASTASSLAPCCSRTLTHCGWQEMVARCRAVLPSSFLLLMSAPFASSIVRHSVRPLEAARWNGDWPLEFSLVGRADFLEARAATRPTSPRCTASSSF